MTQSDTEVAQVTELAKRRGFFFAASTAYGGTAGLYTFGPRGAAVKSNVEHAWRERFTVQEGHFEIEAPTIMPEPVFEASGHLDGFDDMLIKCSECNASHRADHLVETATTLEDAESLPAPEVEELVARYEVCCPSCNAGLAGEAVDTFNLMFETEIGPGLGTPGYLRPETAQGIFVEFPQLKEYARNQLPFGVTQIGRAYRNEISPRQSIVRTREFTQAELEHFIDPAGDVPDISAVADVELSLYPASEQAGETTTYRELTVAEAVEESVIENPWIGYYLGIAHQWYENIGVDMSRFRFRQHLAGERAHYAADCWDAESEVGGDWIEIAGFAHRGNYDLSKHDTHADDDFSVFVPYDEPKTVEKVIVEPDMSVLGPAFGSLASEISEAIKTLAGREPDAFDGDQVTVTVDGTDYTIDVADTNFRVETQTKHGEHIIPHVIEPSFGIDRTVYTLLVHAYREDAIDTEDRSYLSLEYTMAPTTVGVFPLVSNVPELVDRTEAIVNSLRDAGFSVIQDDSGTIGRRYRRQDEIGTPFCVTVDRESTAEGESGTVTIRERDSAEQVRVPTTELIEQLAGLTEGQTTFSDLRSRYPVIEGE